MRARTLQDRLEAILKSAEVLARYVAAVSLASFAARSDASVPAPAGLQPFSGNLNFGDFLRVAQVVGATSCPHPLNRSLGRAFRPIGSERGTGDAALVALLELRNSLGHDLLGTGRARAEVIFAESQPEVQLLRAFQSLDPILQLPLFLVEEQRILRKRIVARRLLLMGDMPDPLPEEIELAGGLEHDSVLYVGITGGVLSVSPYLIWDIALQRANYGIYFLHAIEEERQRLRLVTINDDRVEKNGPLTQEVIKCIQGAVRPRETVRLADGRDFVDEWLEQRRGIERGSGRQIPWHKLDRTTVGWYAHHLALSSGGPGVIGDEDERRLVQERLLDGRDELAEEEIRQLVLLLGQEDVVRPLMGRALVDCRVQKSSDRRMDGRSESTQNIIQSLRLAIDYFGRYVGVDGATLDGLQAVSGSADYIAMREALVNLFIHQDYADARTAGQVNIMESRVVFFNAGKSLVNQSALLEGGRSQARNPLIGRALRLIGFAELAGSGLRELQSVWRQAKRRPPAFKSDEDANTFTLVLDWRQVPDTSDEFWKQRLGATLTHQQAQVLTLVSEGMSGPNSGASLGEVASALGVNVEEAEEIVGRLGVQALVSIKGDRILVPAHIKRLAREAARASET